MKQSVPGRVPSSVDPDDASELTEEFLSKAFGAWAAMW